METWNRLRRRSRAVPSPSRAATSTSTSGEDEARASEARQTDSAATAANQNASAAEAEAEAKAARLREDAFLIHGLGEGQADASSPSPSPSPSPPAPKSPPNSPQDEEDGRKEGDEETTTIPGLDDVQLLSPVHLPPHLPHLPHLPHHHQQVEVVNRDRALADDEDLDTDRLVEGSGKSASLEDSDLVPPLSRLDVPFQETGPGQSLRPPLPAQPRQGGIEARPLPRLLGFEVGARRTLEKKTTEASSSSTLFANDGDKVPEQRFVQEQTLLTSTTVVTPLLLGRGEGEGGSGSQKKKEEQQQQHPSPSPSPSSSLPFREAEEQFPPRGEAGAARARESIFDRVSGGQQRNGNGNGNKPQSSGNGSSSSSNRRNPILQCVGLRREAGHFAAQCLGIVRSK